MTSRSPSRETRRSYRLRTSLSRESRVVRSLARSGSCQMSGLALSRSSSSTCARLPATSTVLLRAVDPSGDLVQSFGVLAHGRTHPSGKPTKRSRIHGILDFRVAHSSDFAGLFLPVNSRNWRSSRKCVRWQRQGLGAIDVDALG